MNKNSKAFTLSEVLITLTVIGVIAAIAVPTLIADWQKTRTVEQLKKTYSALSQTTNRAIADNGPVASWDVLGLNAREFSQQYLIPYLNVFKNKESNYFEYKTLNKTNQKRYSYVFYLLDGTKIGVDTPIQSKWGITVSILVDINGDANPNIMGRDVFYYIYWVYVNSTPSKSGSFIAYGGDWSKYNIINTNAGYACRKGETGELCAALIMKDGWQISEDYPW